MSKNMSYLLFKLAPHQIQPIRTSFLQRVRATAQDDLGQAIEFHTAKGGEPCRDVLRRAKAGEKLILASYCPFNIAGPYKEYGPIFVLAEDHEETPDLDRLSCSATIADSCYLQAQFVLRAYSEQERIVDACVSSPEKAEGDLARLFSRPEVAFILIRFAAYGCYAARINR